MDVWHHRENKGFFYKFPFLSFYPTGSSDWQLAATLHLAITGELSKHLK
jgi:hypothetical protein